MDYLVLLLAGLMVLPPFLLFIGLLLSMILSVFFDHNDNHNDNHEGEEEAGDGKAQ